MGKLPLPVVFLIETWKHAAVIVTSSLLFTIGVGVAQAWGWQVKPIFYVLLLFPALFVGAYRAWREYHIRLLPKFHIKDEHFCQPQSNEIGRSVFIQVEPECLTEENVEECRGYLARIWHMWPAHSTLAHDWEIVEGEPQPLEWSFRGYAPITLIPGIPQRLNVCWIWSEAQSFIQARIENPGKRQLEATSQRGIVGFEVHIVGKKCPTQKIFVIVERGDSWDQPKVKLDTNIPPTS